MLFLLALVLAGCVSLTPQQQEQVDDLQRFADRTTLLYALPRLRISIQLPTNQNIGAVYRQGNVLVNVRMLGSPGLTKPIAHELGHYVLGHEPASTISSQSQWQRAQDPLPIKSGRGADEVGVWVQVPSFSLPPSLFVRTATRRTPDRDQDDPESADTGAGDHTRPGAHDDRGRPETRVDVADRLAEARDALAA